MTQETKHKIKMKLLADAKERAVANLRSMDACPGDYEPNTWEGVMTMYADVLDRGSPEDKAAAGMAVSKWTWAHAECEIRKDVAEMSALFAAEAQPTRMSAPAAK
jgi:hypothetical protein